eukprot:10069027-Ditylum_brightwellii.AAC.1
MTIIPSDNDPDSNIFCYAALANNQQGMLYTNATGALPTNSLDTNQYYFIAYNHNNNCIFAKAILDIKDKIIINTFQSIFKMPVEKGH